MANNTLHLRLHTIMLRVKNLERSRTWYSEKLGLDVIYEDLHYKLISLGQQDEIRLSLWELREGEQPTVANKEAAYPVFISEDARNDHRLLSERGATPGPIEDYPHGLRIFWVSDPDEHRICVIEFLPE